jgi:hypothetical protein
MHVRLRRGITAGIALSSLTLLAACSGSADTDDKAEKAVETSASATPSATPSARPFTAEQAKDIMLTAEELAADGWSTDKDLSEGNSISPTEFQLGVTKEETCQPLLDAFVGGNTAPRPQKYLSGGYSKGEMGPDLLIGIAVYYGDEAEHVMKAELPAEGTCAKTRATLEDETDTYTRGKAQEITAGDESRTIRLTMAETAEYYGAQLDTVVVRVNNAVLVIRQYSYGTADRKALEDAVDKAVEKARQVSEV